MAARRRYVSLLAGALIALAGAGAALAYLTAVGVGSGDAAVTTLASPAPVTASSPTTATVHVTWSAVSAPSGTASDVTYTVKRSSSGGATYGASAGSCGGTLSQATTSCDDTLTAGGTYQYRVTASFRTWTSHAESSGVAVVVDGTPPTSAIAFPNAAFYNAAGWNAGCGTPSTGDVCGTADDPGAGASGVQKVQLQIQRSDNTYWNGSAWVGSSTWNDASGTTSWTYAFDAANLGNGLGYTVRSRAIDDATNMQTTPDSKAFTFDSAAPTTTITFGPTSPNGSAGWYKTTAPTFTLSAADGGSGVAGTFYAIDGGSQQTYSSAVTVPEGQHTVSYWSTDNVGNIEAIHTTATIKVDVTAPATTITVNPASPNGSNGWYKTSAPTFTLSASDAAGGNSGISGSFYKIDSGAQQTYTGAVTIPEGQHTVTYWSSDNAGNVESTHTTSTIKVDLTPPSTTIAISPSSPNGSNGWYKTVAPTFTLSASDATGGNSGIASSSYQIDGGTPQTYASAVTIPEGQHTITYWSTDSAGNVEGSHTTATIKVDTTQPTATDIQATNDSGGTPGKAETGDKLTYTFGETMAPASILTGWSGSSTSVTVHFDRSGNGNVIVTVKDSTDTTAVNVGSVDLGSASYLASTGTKHATFTSSTMVQSGSAITITLGTPAGEAIGTSASSTTMTWTPSTVATDQAGNTMSPTARSEQGAADKEF